MIAANETAAELALDFTRAGFSVIPLRCDGSKMTTLDIWKPYQRQIADDETIADWYERRYRNAGTAIICGAVSGGLEVLDFDQDAETIFPAWHSLVESIAIRLPIVETPSHGLHVYYRCNVICGSTKIAMPAKNTTNTTASNGCKPDARNTTNIGADNGCKPLIESRGEGGYVVGVISPPSVHALNYPYIQIAGPVLPEVPRITPGERKQLWKAAATFDQSNIEAEAIEKLRAKFNRRRLNSNDAKFSRRRENSHDAKLTPWDDYNRRGDWLELLSRHNWTSIDGIHWRHPGAAPGHKHSATLRQASGGDYVLHVFTTSTALDAGKSHSLFNVAVKLDHNGDPKAAARELRKSGYGN